MTLNADATRASLVSTLLSVRWGAARWGAAVLAASVPFAGACGGGKKEPTEPEITLPLTEMPIAPGGSTSSDEPPAESGGLNEDQKAMMKVALKRGGEKAAECAKIVPDAKTFGDGEVTVTFDGKIGKITEVSVGSPFAGTEMENCVKRSFMGEYALTFDGDPLNVPYAIKIQKIAAKPDSKKGK